MGGLQGARIWGELRGVRRITFRSRKVMQSENRRKRNQKRSNGQGGGEWLVNLLSDWDLFLGERRQV